MERYTLSSHEVSEHVDSNMLDYPPTHSMAGDTLTGSPAYATVLMADVTPVFSGNNVGTLAVNLVTNRLLAGGATPRTVSSTMIIDGDTSATTVNSVMRAMRSATVEAEMEWKVSEGRVLESGPATGIALSLFAIGELPPQHDMNITGVRSGDVLVLTGAVGGYGAAVEASRRGLNVTLEGAGHPLNDVVHAMMRESAAMRGMIFPDGGLEQAVARLRGVAEVAFDRSEVIVDPAVVSVCDSMGLNPLEMPTAGAMIAIVPSADANRVVEAVRRSAYGSMACVIGEII